MSTSPVSDPSTATSSCVANPATTDITGSAFTALQHALDRDDVRACPVCCGSIRAPFSSCLGCVLVGRQLRGRLVPVRPVRLVRRDGEMHRLLVAYKAAQSSFVRREAARRLSIRLAAFLLEQVDMLGPRAGGIRHLVTVPSTGLGRPSWNGTHPLVGVVAGALADLACHGRPLHLALNALERGDAPLGHLRASPAAYRVRDVATSCQLSEAPAIVVDDLYTSGAHAQSAARALRDAGIIVTAIVPIGRLLRSGDPRANGAA